MHRIASAALVLALVFCACGDGFIEQTDLPSGSFNREGAEIIGGSVYDGLPAVGALIYNGNMHCSGTLIGPRKVLTAGHCVSGYSASKMQFVIGPSLSQVQATIGASAIQAHPNYNGQSITNDIGLVTLKQDAPVSPLGVVRLMDSSWAGKSLFFVGYGVNNGYNQTGAGIKRAVWMNITSVASSTFSYEDPNKNTCNGDSGGPAFAQDSSGNYLVAGVTSYGDYYCNQYGVDTRVDAYLSFIGETGSDADGGGDDGGGTDQQDPCNGETYAGRCDGDTVVWCENSQVYTQDCASSGKVCGWSDANNYYGCVNAPEEPEEPQDPCQGETYAGRCENNVLIWCENEQVQTQNCAASGKVCVYDQAKQYYACREAAAVDPCNGETFSGRCDGDTVIWCENNEVNSINCAAYHEDCGYNSAKGYYDCI